MRILCCGIFLLLSTLANANLVQVGEGVARWGPFKVYAATFFTQAGLTLEQALAEHTAARLELCYAQALSAEDFIQGADYALPQHLTDELQQAVMRLHAAYQPVKPGDCYQLDYQPQQGTRLLLNGRELVRIATPDFKAVYFGIWLGAQPLSATLKQGLTQGLKA